MIFLEVKEVIAITKVGYSRKTFGFNFYNFSTFFNFPDKIELG